MSTRISLIIPVYNVEPYLQECLDSVIRQTLSDIEIICVNDKSTDRSLDILQKSARQDQRIRIINNPENMGLSAARNIGLENANGKYIYFLDSDDMITDNAMERLWNVAEDERTDIIFFDSLMIFENSEEHSENDLFTAKYEYPEVLTGAEFLGAMRTNDDIREPVWLQFWNHEFLKKSKLQFPVGILHEDLLFTFVSLMEASRVRCINEQLHFYRIRRNAITSVRVSERHITGLVKTYVDILDYWNHRGRDKGVDFAIEHYLDRISWKVNRYLDTFKDCNKIYEALGEDGVAKHIFKLILEPGFR